MGSYYFDLISGCLGGRLLIWWFWGFAVLWFACLDVLVAVMRCFGLVRDRNLIEIDGFGYFLFGWLFLDLGSFAILGLFPVVWMNTCCW